MNSGTCPWDFLKPGTIQFCEAHLCSWVTEPANAWSNIGFLIAGVLILREAHQKKQNHLIYFGWISIFIGICSGFFHASSTLLGQTIDFGSMFLLSTFMVVLNFSRWKKAWSKTLLFVSLGFLLISLLSLILIPSTGIPLFGFQFLLALFIELLISRNPHPPFSHRPLFILLSLFAVSLGIWVLDITGLLCVPSNHIFTGHSMWHLLNALAIFFGAKFYRQFELSSKKSGENLKTHF